MVVEPWIHNMRSQVSTSATTAKKKDDAKTPSVPDTAPQKANTIGILTFEVANAMSKAVNLYKSLSENDIFHLHNDILKSHAIRTLVSTDESYLLELALTEKLDELNRVAAVVSRLGRRCSEQALVGFEHVYSDLLGGRLDVGKLGFLVKAMEGAVKKMKRYINSTVNLYGELGVLNELEQGLKKFNLAQHHTETQRALKQKIRWQQHDVKHLRDLSLWNQSYDKIVGLMARVVCNIYARILLVFGESALALEGLPDYSTHRSGLMVVNHHRLFGPGKTQTDVSVTRSGQIQVRRQGASLCGQSLGFACGSSPGRLFMGCLSLSSSASWNDSDEYFVSESRTSPVGTSSPFSGDIRQCKGGKHGGSRFGSKSSITMHAPSSSVGGSALALHYANVIVIIEKLLRHPHLVGEEARYDLYQMLPMSLRMLLRRNLKSYVKNLAICDAPLAHDWKEKLDKILSWLAPLAHNMIRWQIEHNFEQQQIVPRTNVLLLQTIYFADREKTEAAISELLVGLNYICRYEHQQSALVDCRSSTDFDECLEWQLQY